ncbi:zf-HC2 domain-containing protein [Cohnella lubricantis]|uniref:Anti-sigma-W factor RsiW n=1 Tax=Cohnella lubricantis TaxID=2163172 RepID=A0A841T9V2_9BACL|nr:zf-HC2 domain-containing protein [Cohnella lubricantis]MBB6678084.1 zf-HC2 domain-containing protein [Cohnella lubricantis]MBP2120446.1 mycothiol system anti-sigma-R factor [Cohnella lubricantis]
MKCNAAIAYMHDYLDGELPREQTAELQHHLAECAGCRNRLDSLEKTDALLRSAPKPESAPDYLAYRIMKSLPKSRNAKTWTTWVRRHPALSAAAMFLVIMVSSFVAMWNQSQELTVSGDLDHVVIRGNTVIVPAGQQVAGDLTIENGTAQVEGDVQGNLTIIDGNVTLASTAHIAGKIKTIDRAVDWAWYKVTSWFDTIAYGS